MEARKTGGKAGVKKVEAAAIKYAKSMAKFNPSLGVDDLRQAYLAGYGACEADNKCQCRAQP